MSISTRNSIDMQEPANDTPLNPTDATAPGTRKKSQRPHTAGRERLNVPLEKPAGDAAHAEIFYLQKQVQAQTLMVIQLEDGERIEGKIEWFDRDSIKVCSQSRQRVLIFKSAIKYIFKAAEPQHSPSGKLG